MLLHIREAVLVQLQELFVSLKISVIAWDEVEAPSAELRRVVQLWGEQESCVYGVGVGCVCGGGEWVLYLAGNIIISYDRALMLWQLSLTTT